jgi:integrase
MLLLAIRMGLRCSDIRSLRLDNIIWDEASIDIVQKKTGRPLCIPMPDDVGNALADYLRHARPKTLRREVFLRAVSPREPVTSTALSRILQKYRRKAGLAPAPESGMHSLRHTMATRLMEGKVPPETICGLLGHVHVDTTRLYLQTDVMSLRAVGLDPDEEVRHV